MIGRDADPAEIQGSRPAGRASRLCENQTERQSCRTEENAGRVCRACGSNASRTCHWNPACNTKAGWSVPGGFSRQFLAPFWVQRVGTASAWVGAYLHRRLLAYYACSPVGPISEQGLHVFHCDSLALVGCKMFIRGINFVDSRLDKTRQNQ